MLVIHSWGGLARHGAERGKTVGAGISDFIRPSIFFLSFSKVSSIDVSIVVFVCLFACKTISEEVKDCCHQLCCGVDLHGS